MRGSTASFSSPSRARASIAGRSARLDRRRTRTSATTRPRRRRRRPASGRACVAGLKRRRARRRGPARRASCRAALRLISEGALDRDGVEALADRLGVTARHLRRLFVQHLGATPIDVALTRRVHFAKKLLDETPLPIAQVAFAAGFGSLRRFNGEMRRTYLAHADRAAQARRASDRQGSECYQFRLAYRPPYDWAARDRRSSRRAPRRASSSSKPTAISGRSRSAARRARSPIAPADEGAGAARSTCSSAIRARCSTIVERVRRMFDLGADPAVIARAVVRRSAAEARGRRARRHSHAGRVGSVRDRRARDPRPADLGRAPRRRSPAASPSAGARRSTEWSRAGTRRIALSDTRSTGRRAARRGRHHLVARLDAPRAGARGPRRRVVFDGVSTLDALARDSRHRRLDGAVCRDARAQRARRIPVRRSRAAAHGRRLQRARARTPQRSAGGPGARTR